MFKTLRHLFTPHRSNNHRPRLLHPAGLAVMIGILLVSNSMIEIVKATPPTGLVLGYASNITADQVLLQTNAERAKVGLSPLQLNQQLNQAALAKAQDMFADDYWAHTAPDGTTPWVFIKGSGYRYSVAGENLARDFDDTSSMVVAWMNSPTHKANVIHAKYTQTGIAVVDGILGGVETTLVVHMFGTPAGITSLTEKAKPAPQIASGNETETVPANDIGPEFIDIPLHSTPDSAYPQTVLSNTHTNSRVTVISPLRLKQSIALAMVFLLIAILVADEIIIRRKKVVRFVGHNFTHIGFLSAVLILVGLATQGGVL